MARISSGLSATPTSSTPSKHSERIRARAGSVPRRRVLLMTQARRRGGRLARGSAQEPPGRGSDGRGPLGRLAPARVVSASSRDRAAVPAVGTPETRTIPRAPSGIGRAGPRIPLGPTDCRRGPAGLRTDWPENGCPQLLALAAKAKVGLASLLTLDRPLESSGAQTQRSGPR